MQELKALPQSQVQDRAKEIWAEFLAPDASCPINVDARSYELTKKNMEVLDRWSFDCAAVRLSRTIAILCIKYIFPGTRVPFNEERQLLKIFEIGNVQRVLEWIQEKGKKGQVV